MRQYLLLFLLTLSISVCIAQEIHGNRVVHFTVADGLASGNVHKITQDKQGFIWIATENGVSKYDGYTCRNYGQESKSHYGISHNFVHDVVPHHEQGVWIGTLSGLNQYHIETGTFTHTYFKERTHTLLKPIIQIVPMEHGTCFVRTDDNNVHVYSSDLDTLTKITYTGFTPRAFPNTIAAIDSNTIIVGDKKGYLYSLTTQGIAHAIDSLPFAITTIHIISPTEYFIADANGTLYYYTHNNQKNTYPFPLKKSTFSERYISCIQEINDSIFYIGTLGSGMLRFSKNNGWCKNPSTEYNLINKNIAHIFLDKDSSIWISHTYGGISLIPKQHHSIIEYTLPKQIAKEKITHIQSEQSNIWIATEGNGLFIYNTKSQKYTHYNAESGIADKPFDNQITSLFYDSTHMWIATYNTGVFAINTHTHTLKFYNELQTIPSQDIAVVYADSQNQIWLGTYDKGVYVFNTITKRIEKHYHIDADIHYKISTNGITCFFEDSKQNMWIGGYYGLSKILPNNTIIQYIHTTHPGIQNNVITGIFEDSEQDIWIGTLKGASIYDISRDTIIPFTVRFGDFKHVVHSLFALDTKTIVLITPRSIYTYTIPTKTLGYIGSCPNGEFSQNAYTIQNKTQFLVGTQQGIVNVHINSTYNEKISGNIELVDISVNGISIFTENSDYIPQRISNNYTLELPYYEDNISFTFTDFVFDKHFLSEYMYKLDGFQNEWQHLVGHNFVNFTNVPGGNYIFRVRKQTANGFSSEELKVYITIQKAFWETWLFYILIGLFIGIILFFIYTSRVNRILIMRNKLQKQVELRMKDIRLQTEEIQAQKDIITEQRDIANKKSAEFAREREQMLAFQKELETNVLNLENARIESEQKEQNLRKEYNKILLQYNALAHFSREMIFRINLPSEDFQYVSPASEIITGYKPEEFYNDKNLFKKLITTEDKDGFKKFRKFMIEGKVPPLTEYRIMHKNGSERWVAQHSHIIRNEQSEVIAYEAMIIDVTDIKTAEQKKNAARKRSEDFAQVTQSENTTNSIQLLAEILNKPDISLDEKQAFIEQSNNETSSLQMIDDIIDIYKIESGELHLNNSQCYVNNILQELHSSFTILKNKNKKKHISLELEIPVEEENFSFYTDTYRLRQIIMNLLGNAFKFTKQGSIRFGYNLIDKRGGDTDKEIVFFVQDTGIGISEKQIPYVFERFKSSDGKLGFTGVGLYLSHKLVDLLGGKMWVESVVGTGSIFQFSLPIEKMKGLKKIDAQELSTLDNETIDWSKKTLLLAEDEQNNFDYVTEALKKTHIQIIWVTNGEDAINTYKEKQRDIDVILMDIQMPKVNGYEATQRIKEIDKDVPIIAQTAYANSEAKLNCFDAGCDNYLAKPYKSKDLIEVLSKYL